MTSGSAPAAAAMTSGCARFAAAMIRGCKVSLTAARLERQ